MRARRVGMIVDVRGEAAVATDTACGIENGLRKQHRLGWVACRVPGNALRPQTRC